MPRSPSTTAELEARLMEMELRYMEQAALVARIQWLLCQMPISI
jgi:uncharacterized coiled-coil protein SlyX